MSYVLLTYEGNWADEMDVKYLNYVEEKDCEKLRNLIEIYFKLKNDFTICVGSNETIDIHDYCFNEQPMSNEELDILKKFISFDDREMFDYDFWLDEILLIDSAELLSQLNETEILYIQKLLEEV